MAKSTKRLPIVRIAFDDHCQATGGEADVVRCELFGVLYKETKTTYHIVVWVADQRIDHNADTYCVRKHPGIKMKRLGWY